MGACSGSRGNKSFPRPMTNSRRTALTGLRWLARALALAAAYFLVAKIGLRYATIGPSISPVWPPTGVAVAALVLLGPGYWPAILLGAFLANATTSIPVLAAAGIACGNAAEATVAAYLLRHRAGQHLTLDDLVGVRTLVAVAAPLGTLASATVGVTTLWLAHVVPGPGVWSALSLWWAGDYLGALVVAPVLLTWLGPAGRHIAWRTAVELSLLVGAAVIHSSPLAIYTLDPASTVLTWNRAAEALYGWRADEVIGRPLPTIAQDTEDHLRLRDRVFRGEALRGVEVTRGRKDGTSVNISLSVALLHDAAGRVSGMLSIAADLTELRQLEGQYRQAQKMEAVGRLAGGIAHDRSEEHTSELQSRFDLVCRLLLEKKKKIKQQK